MANISSWLSEVSSKVPGVTKTEIDSVVRLAIRHFCDKTLLYIRQLTAINIVDGTPTYTLVAPTDNSIVGVERVEINGVPVSATSEDVLNRSLDAWRAQESDQATSIMVDAEKVLRLKQIPTVNYTGGLVVWANLKPSPTTDTVPDFIYDDWFEAILYGALQRLFELPGKPWVNVQLGKYYQDKYDAELSIAKSKKTTGKAKLALRIQAPPFNAV